MQSAMQYIPMTKLSRDRTEIRGPLDRGPRVGEFHGPRTAGGRAVRMPYLDCQNALFGRLDLETLIF